jgi:hypothetical protein
MKLISEDPRTTRHLGRWASGKDVFVSSFYFWSSGTAMQMSQEELIRTLLYEALQKLPHLVTLVFKDCMETFIVFGNGVVWDAPWGMTELFEAFKRLVAEITKSKKMFLLIDGLDEYNGNYSEQLELITIICSLLSSNVKICVSSRPWNVFADTFNARPSLRLENLTYADISYYISSKLSNNLGFVALKRGDPEFASSLIDNVSAKASGVFLWVVLVVQSLLEGLTDGERLSELQRRLDSIPADLETLFWKILKSVDFGRISQILQIVEDSINTHGKLPRKALTLIQLSFAGEDDPEFVFKMPTVQMPGNKIDSRTELMRRRLNVCGKGLLEPHIADYSYLPDAMVEYLHRTVKDFIRRPDIWSKLLEASTPPFDPALHLAVSEVARIKIIEIAAGSSTTLVFWKKFINSILNIVRYGPTSMESQIRLLNELDMAAGVIMTRGHQGSPITYRSCPLSTASNVFDASSFLHLAVKLQLNTYVKAVAIRLHRTRQIDFLWSLFQMAATEYRTTDESFKYENPSLRMIETFLELGINPNQRSQPLRDGNMTIWQMVISDIVTRPGILPLRSRSVCATT